MAQLFAPGCSITMTRRHRFLWAAWWTEPPSHVPFRKPDASDGGASSHAEALAQAQQQAGRELVLLDPLWARAWNRILRGEDPWPSASSREPRRPPEAPAAESAAMPAESVWSVLGVERDVSADELKAAYRRKVLEAHPDQGGDAAAFRKVLHAYEEASRRLRKPRGRRG